MTPIRRPGEAEQNIRLRWSRDGMEGMQDYYKHSAPLEPGWDGGDAGLLQTFGSAGAGMGWEGMQDYYKHLALLEPGW